VNPQSHSLKERERGIALSIIYIYIEWKHWINQKTHHHHHHHQSLKNLDEEDDDENHTHYTFHTNKKPKKQFECQSWISWILLR
jgi:hypothetical protein